MLFPHGVTLRNYEGGILQRPNKSTLDNLLDAVSARQRDRTSSKRFLWRRAAGYALAFVVMCFLIALEATQEIDQWAFTWANALASEPLDIASSLITLLGNFEVSSIITVAWAVFGWRQRGLRGLVPLLLFVGVAVEVVLKFYLPHPGPPQGFSRNLEFLPPIRFSTPYSFPSGHMLRAAFLMTLFTTATEKWRVSGWIFVIAMALTRPYLNEHWVSDVIGGFLLGQAFAWAALAIAAGGAAPGLQRYCPRASREVGLHS
jgi:undecaprenyl-diphosphatase